MRIIPYNVTERLSDLKKYDKDAYVFLVLISMFNGFLWTILSYAVFCALN